MNNNESCPQETHNLQDIDILRGIQRNCAVFEQNSVGSLNQGSFLIQFVFYKAYTGILWRFFHSVFLYSECLRYFFLWDIFTGSTSLYYLSYCMLSYHCTLPNNLTCLKKNACFPFAIFHKPFLVSYFLILVNDTTIYPGFSSQTLMSHL